MPTDADVRYGEHERHVLDFWQAPSPGVTPAVVVIHGGGWTGGSKERMERFVNARKLLAAEISVIAINYRLLEHARDVEPPVKAPMHDAARALQFVRSRADAWNIDPKRIGLAGGSAGACTSLWLAFHHDMADSASDDPVTRLSTRVSCAAVCGPQTSLDPLQMREWIPNIQYGGHAFGKESFDRCLRDREHLLPWIRAYSPYALASEGDPPIYMRFNRPPALGEEQPDATHSTNFGLALQQRCRELNIHCELVYSGAPDVTHESPTDFLIANLSSSA
ncbi:MAG: alpha/beta hydrolase [Phycisphaeraceae bacterium]